jgi:hypothetical protein
MQRQEIPNNTDEQVREYLLKTLALLEDVNVPIVVRPQAFEQVFQAFAGKQIVMSQPPTLDPRLLDGLRGR